LTDKTLSLCAIAEAFQKIDKPAQRDRVHGVALKLAHSAGDARKRSAAQADVAASLSDCNEREVSARIFELALESAGKIESPDSRAYALADVAKRLSQAGFRAKAHGALDQAERAAAKVPQADMQMQALQYVRSLMGKLPRGE
jgi:hypothetical protein